MTEHGKKKKHVMGDPIDFLATGFEVNTNHRASALVVELSLSLSLSLSRCSINSGPQDCAAVGGLRQRPEQLPSTTF